MSNVAHSPSNRPARRISARPRLASVNALEVVRAASRADVSVDELSALAVADPAFSLRLLAMVNSPLLGRGRPIADAKQAASLLGLRGLRAVGISLIVSDMVPMGEAGEVLLAIALRRAIAAKWVAGELRHPDADACFSTGLMLEMGVFAHAARDLAATVKIANIPAAHRPVYEGVRGLTPHPAFGAILGERFQLPRETTEAILHHHDEVPPAAGVVRVAWCAEQIAAVFEAPAVSLARAQLLARCDEVQLSPQRVAQFLEELPALVEAAAATFDRPLAPQMDLDQLRADAASRLIEMNEHLEETVASLRRLVTEKEAMSKELEAANSQLATLNQTLSLEAATDPLTSLPNRRCLERDLDRDLARVARSGAVISVLMVDIDHFKRFNDTHGHLAGDEVIKEVAHKLGSSLRRGDLAARFGGEEFCIVLPEMDSSGAILAARRLRLAVERSEVKYQNQSLRVTVSIGVATTAPNEPSTRESLICRADTALYRAKGLGRNCVAWADADGHVAAPIAAKEATQKEAVPAE